MGISVKHELNNHVLYLKIRNNGHDLGEIEYYLEEYLHLKRHVKGEKEAYFVKKYNVEHFINTMLIHNYKNDDTIKKSTIQSIAKAVAKRYNIYKDISWAEFFKKIMGDVDYVQYFIAHND